MNLLKLSLLVFVILFLGCKKEDSPQPSPSAGSGGSLPDGSPSSATSFYGTLSCRTLDFSISGSLTRIYENTPYASFYSTPKPYAFGDSITLIVDSVSCNGLQLQLSGTSFYDDMGFASITLPATWHVDGNNGVPDITYSHSPQMPGYSGYGTLPDTISHVGAFTVQLTGLSNYSKLIFILDDDQGHLLWKQVNAAGSTATVMFTAAEMADMTSGGTNTSVGVWMTKNNARAFGGKAYNFASEYIFAKPIVFQ